MTHPHDISSEQRSVQRSEQSLKELSKQTIDTINQLLDDGANRMGILIRHSHRFFSQDARLEPFMGLTNQGKHMAFDFGRTLRARPQPRLFSSFMGRCIETAYLIDKGFSDTYHCHLDHNELDKHLSPFYVKDIEKAIPLIEKHGNAAFLRKWFDNRIDDRIMEHPEQTADILCDCMVERIKHLDKDMMAVCISHDWNIFPLKEFKLNLKHETAGDVDYLDGVVFFEKENRFYITHYQTQPVLL